MNDFDDRKNAFESKFSHDDELKFRVMARRAKLFGLWLGEQMGLPVDESYALGKGLAQFQLTSPGSAALIAEAEAILSKANKSLAQALLVAQLEHFGVKAREQIMQEDKPKA